MKLYIKIVEKWVDLTEYVHNPTNIILTVDGKYITSNITLRLPTNYEHIDARNPIPPKTRYKLIDGEEEIELVNAFYFISTDQSNVMKRKEVLDKNGVVITPALYEHKLNGNEMLYNLEGHFAPSYTITQPKTKFFDRYRVSAGANFLIDHTYTQDGVKKFLPQGTKQLLGEQNNEQNLITFDYDFSSNRHLITLNDINVVDYALDLKVNSRQTAASKFERNFLGIKTIEDIGFYESNLDLTSATTPPTASSTRETARMNFKITKEYYDDMDLLIKTETETKNFKYKGGLVEATSGGIFGATIKSFPPLSESKLVFNIVGKENASYVKVYIEIVENMQQYNISYDTFAKKNVLSKVDFTYNGIYYNTNRIVTNIMELQTMVLSSTYEDPLLEQTISLYQFLEKAIFDYNLNNREKITIDQKLKVRLSETAKESEWVDYNYKELIERVFKYVGLRPFLTKDNILTFIEEKTIPYDISFEKTHTESEQIGDFHYDRVISKSKNLVSENDEITEIISVSSTDEEFSQLTNDSIGFLLSNDIYYVKKAILYAPNFTFKITHGLKSYEFNTNIGVPFKWDITSRLFEEDIYNSFPDVRYDIKKTDLIESKTLRKVDTSFSKSNTISYKSGSNKVSNIGHLAPEVPSYVALALLVPGVSNYLIPQYSIIEMLIVLSYELIPDDVEIENFPDFDPMQNLSNLFSMSLELTYVPIFKDITTKQVSNMKSRRGLNFERKFNISDRTVSLSDSNQVLKREMESKGNIKTSFSENLNNTSESLSINTKLNNNYLITTKELTVLNGKVQASYEVQQNFILQNEDIRLPVEFDRYNVPYEYVNREIEINNHLIFETQVTTVYNGDYNAIDKDFLNQTLFSSERELNKPLYAKLKLKDGKKEELETLMRVGVLEDSFSLIMTGKFLDNYSAGVQRYIGSSSNLVYSQPYRYTDAKGRLSKVEKLEIGYHDIDKRLKANGVSYNMLNFPEGKEVDPFEKKLVSLDDVLLMKDAREGISFLHTSFLVSGSENIKFYSYKGINRIGALTSDIDFVDDLTIDDLSFINHGEDIANINVVDIFKNQFQVTITLNETSASDYLNGIVLYNVDGVKRSLVGLIKNFQYIDNNIIFYITSSMYGIDKNLSETSGKVFLLEMESNQKITIKNANIMSLSNGLDLTLNYGDANDYEISNKEVNVSLNNNIELINATILKLSGIIDLEVDYKRGESDSKSINNNINLVNNIVLKGELLNLNNNIILSVLFGEESVLSKRFESDINSTNTMILKGGLISLNNSIGLETEYDGEELITKMPTVLNIYSEEVYYDEYALEMRYSNNDVEPVDIYLFGNYITTIAGNSLGWYTLDYTSTDYTGTSIEIKLKAKASNKPMSKEYVNTFIVQKYER